MNFFDLSREREKKKQDVPNRDEVNKIYLLSQMGENTFNSYSIIKHKRKVFQENMMFYIGTKFDIYLKMSNIDEE